MLALFFSELNIYMMNEVQPELFVDIGKGQKLRININITFHHIGCRCELHIKAHLSKT